MLREWPMNSRPKLCTLLFSLLISQELSATPLLKNNAVQNYLRCQRSLFDVGTSDFVQTTVTDLDRFLATQSFSREYATALGNRMLTEIETAKRKVTLRLKKHYENKVTETEAAINTMMANSGSDGLTSAKAIYDVIDPFALTMSVLVYGQGRLNETEHRSLESKISGRSGSLVEGLSTRLRGRFYYPTFRWMRFQDFNILRPFSQLAILGFVSDVAEVDGKRFHPLKFTEHDFAHSIGPVRAEANDAKPMEARLKLSEAFLRHAQGLSTKRDFVIAHTIWFYWTHELDSDLNPKTLLENFGPPSQDWRNRLLHRHSSKADLGQAFKTPPTEGELNQIASGILKILGTSSDQ